MINLNAVTYHYNRKAKPALQDITASVDCGLYLLAGENGAGKTTLLHLIAGMIAPTTGTCMVDGNETTSLTPADKSQMFLLEDNMLFPGKTIISFARLHSRFYPEFSHDTFIHNLSMFGLDGTEPMKSMSLGNRKKAQLAYVLSLGVKILLLDEPTNALDIEGRETFRKILLSSMTPDQTVIVATHTVHDLEKLFDGAILLKGSELQFAGPEERITSKLSFEHSQYPIENALYTENQAGLYMAICPADGTAESRIDWRLLYSALHSDNANSILELIQTKTAEHNDHTR